MKPEQIFFIDIMGLMPEDSILLIQAPSLDSQVLLQNLNSTEFPYFKSLKLTLENRQMIVEEMISKDAQRDFQSLEIRKGESLLFEAYDGVEYGIISKHINLTKEFIEKYIEGQMCLISPNW